MLFATKLFQSELYTNYVKCDEIHNKFIQSTLLCVKIIETKKLNFGHRTFVLEYCNLYRSTLFLFK